MKTNALLWLRSWEEADLATITNLIDQIFKTMGDVFRFDGTLNILKKIWSFEFLFAQMGFNLIIETIQLQSIFKTR